MASPEVDVAETAQLLSGFTDVEEDELVAPLERPGDRGRCSGRCRTSKCGWFLIEPVLTAYCFCEFPMKIIAQRYLDRLSVAMITV